MAILEWILLNSYPLGYVVMGGLAGLVSHIYMFERTHEVWPLRQHAWGLFSSWSKAALICVIVYQLASYWSWKQQVALVTAGVLCLFPNDTIRLLWDFGKSRVFVSTKSLGEREG